MSTNPLTVTAPDGMPFIDFEREFDAPVAAVFRAHAEPELLTQWLGPHGYEMKVDHFDFRTGGSYRYLHTDQNGEAYAFNGVCSTPCVRTSSPFRPSSSRASRTSSASSR
jgi:Activator of Hsp90 ATPase homolog 1-like protein